MKKIGIIGTRRRDTSTVQDLIVTKLWEIYDDGDYIVSGGCPKGGDRFAEAIAKANGLPILIFYPNYKKFKQAAPIIRNTSIAEVCDYIIACVIRPEEGVEQVLQRREGGTEDTLRKFVKLQEHNKNRIILV